MNPVSCVPPPRLPSWLAPPLPPNDASRGRWCEVSDWEKGFLHFRVLGTRSPRLPGLPVIQDPKDTQSCIAQASSWAEERKPSVDEVFSKSFVSGSCEGIYFKFAYCRTLIFYYTSLLCRSDLNSLTRTQETEPHCKVLSTLYCSVCVLPAWHQTA